MGGGVPTLSTQQISSTNPQIAMYQKKIFSKNTLFIPSTIQTPNSVSSRPVSFISRTSARIFPPAGHGHSRYLFHGRGVGPELEFFLEGCNRNTVRARVGGGNDLVPGNCGFPDGIWIWDWTIQIWERERDWLRAERLRRWFWGIPKRKWERKKNRF